MHERLRRKRNIYSVTWLSNPLISKSKQRQYILVWGGIFLAVAQVNLPSRARRTYCHVLHCALTLVLVSWQSIRRFPSRLFICPFFASGVTSHHSRVTTPSPLALTWPSYDERSLPAAPFHPEVFKSDTKHILLYGNTTGCIR